jgi:hypothetical protein
MDKYKEMEQFLPIMLDIFNNPKFIDDLGKSGYVFDFKIIFKEFLEFRMGRTNE